MQSVSDAMGVDIARQDLRDIVALSTLPAIWFGAEPVRIAESLAAALFTTLTPDFVCVACLGEPGAAPVAAVQTGRYQSSPELAAELTPTLLAWARARDADEVLHLPNPHGPGTLQVLVNPIGHMAEYGVVAAGFSIDRPPTPFHRLLLNIATTQAATAVQNARLLASLREESRTLEVLNRTGAALAEEFDLERVVQTVTDAAVNLTGAQFGAFFYTMVDDAGGSLTLYTLSGAERAAFEQFPHPRATQVFAPTFNGEGIIRSADITLDARYGQNAPHSGMPDGHLPVRSYLAVPVSSPAGEVIGGLFFGHAEAGVFSERSERVVVGLAAQAGISIENARLFQAVQRANQTLEERVRERTAELEAAHEALRQAQKMEAIGQLTGGIAHDFNNLLTVIRGSADLLQRADLPDEKRKRYIEAISTTADRAAKLTGQLLAFARRQPLAPEVFDAAARVNDISEMLQSVLGSRIALEIAGTCRACFISADPAQFETAIVNMAVNARDAMDGEGRLTISIGADGDASGQRSPAGGNYISLAVSDTGEGIAPEHLERIFEPFFTTKDIGKGTGLGLSQVYGFAKQSGGWIDVRSAPGAGATFTLYLPQVMQEPRGSASRASSLDRALRTGRVLVVEDNPDVRSFVEQILNDLGFETTLSGSAQAALDLLESQGDVFDVIFSDVVMPGIGGVDFGRRVHERWPGIPVVLTTGYSHVLAGDANHGFPLLQKPYSAQGLARILSDALQRRRARPLHTDD